jgi:hypothetical protein
MADLAVASWPANGADPTITVVPSNAGDQFVNDGKTMFLIKNTGGSAVAVTFAAARKSDQGFATDLVISVLAGATQRIGFFQPERFNDGGGRVSVGYATVTGITIRAARFTDLRGVTSA